MLKQKLAVAAGIVGLGALMALPSLAAPKDKAAPVANDGREQCYMCHTEVQSTQRGIQTCQAGLYGLSRQDQRAPG